MTRKRKIAKPATRAKKPTRYEIELRHGDGSVYATHQRATLAEVERDTESVTQEAKADPAVRVMSVYRIASDGTKTEVHRRAIK